jgi:predicted MPP superfamily phosphohydrolase
VSETETLPTAEAPPRPGRRSVPKFAAIVAFVVTLLFGVPLWTLVYAGNGWPPVARAIGTLIFVAGAATLVLGMMRGHGRRASDRWSIAGDTALGVVWVFFTWSLIGDIVRGILALAGVGGLARVTAAAVAVVAAGLCLWGHYEAMRVPRVKRVEVVIDRLGAGLDGMKVVLITDTHYGPIDRAKWSAGVTDAINALDADIVCHTGDIADGTVERRLPQARHLDRVQAKLARTYVTGNHEYFGEAQGWLDYMASIGWEALHNRHIVVERGGDRLVIAGIDDRTAAGSGLAAHGADPVAALAGADRALPVLWLAHQPKQITMAVEHDVDLQISGHTHGGQIWPFHYLVMTDQPAVAGLSRHGARTQLYTSRGAGFWGPPLRVFAPSEISLIVLRTGAASAAHL